MRQIVELLPLSKRFHLAVLLILIILLHACAVRKMVSVEPLAPPGPLIEKVEPNDFLVAGEDDVIGRLARIKLQNGDTLPDIARHFKLGINGVCAANPGTDLWLPEPGTTILLPLSFILPDSARKDIVINLASMRLFQFKEDGELLGVSTYPVGVGTKERPSPLGPMYVERKAYRPTWYVPASIAEDHRKKGDILPPKVPPGPLNPLGEHALYLSERGYLIHGTNKPFSIGLRATNGCMRLYPEDIKRVFESTPVKTPVRIVNQPYLVGQRDGVVYVEAHTPFEEDSGTAELEKMFGELRNIEKKPGRTLDWKKIKEVVVEARGIPVPVSGIRPGSEKGITETVEVRHPDKLEGRPEIPELKSDAWYILAATVPDRIDALRIAAIINHQGPHIPARVLSKMDSHRVIAGPFSDIIEAKDAAKRMKFDLEIDGILVEPVNKK